MMNSQQSKSTARVLAAGQVLALDGAGEVSIVSGRVWLTRSGDRDDHVLEAGESFSVRPVETAIVEPWGAEASAVVAWRPDTLAARARRVFARTCDRCWELMNPAGRVGIGTAAALVAVAVAALLFGPLSEARVRALVAPAGSAGVVDKHNTGGAAAASARRGTAADGSDTGQRSSRTAHEAGRHPPGAA